MLSRAAWPCLTSRRPSSRPPFSYSHDTESKLFHCACVQDGSIAFVVLEVTADCAAIHGTMTACMKAWLRVVVLVLFCFARHDTARLVLTAHLSDCTPISDDHSPPDLDALATSQKSVAVLPVFFLRVSEVFLLITQVGTAPRFLLRFGEVALFIPSYSSLTCFL